ncbi:ATP-binding protein [Herbaspirillum camelliae]|uniref:ATP-binding protein n=1 Tax=Herbaspirillum camelliae TaxID=1892903 RepID=UPI000B210FEE|nr:ATP-binding protein [Herbaspirillum camelliae]
MRTNSYWIDRFRELENLDVLREKATISGPVLIDLFKLPLEQASLQLQQAFRSVFYPTNQCLSILRRLIGVSAAHCATTYTDAKSFMSGVYAESPPLLEFSPPLYLTGLAGVGKTEILNTFQRLLSQSDEVVVDDKHPPFRILPPWLVTVRSRSSARDVLGVLANQDGKPYELIKRCRKLAYRDAVPFLVADELQFVTGSDSANTRVSQMLMSLAYIGIPFLFAANFSMLQRLMRRPGEEQQRLLAQPIILHPDAPDSEDWTKTIEALVAVAPANFAFDPQKLAPDLHRYTFGRKRALSELLSLAFRIEFQNGSGVTSTSLTKAYKSSAYTVYRDETEFLFKQAIANRPSRGRPDLWCPIPDDGNIQLARIVQFSTAAQERAAADAEMRSALTAAEIKAVAAIENPAKRKNRNSGSKVLSIHRTPARDASTLSKNMDSFLDDV